MKFLLALALILPLAGKEKPNILFILADDLGINDLSCEGSTYYETPHIDAIARGGMRFTNGYSTCQVCSPSRASIMSGQYPARVGITDWIGAATGTNWKRNDRILPPENKEALPADLTTLPEALRAGGYRTFFAGKWHLGNTGSGPQDHGFEVNRGGYWSGSPRGGYFSPYNNPELEDGPVGEALPARLARETIDFIGQDSVRPFFAFLSFYSVHGPIQTSPDLWKKYREKAVAAGLASERFKIDRTLPVRQVQDCPIYGGMMEAMDQAVGLVTSHLKEAGLADNTIIIFTSDNGGVSSGDAFATSCLPLRGGKGRQWEGGIRQPYYFVVPGLTRPGSTSAQLVTGTDFLPTLVELADIKTAPAQDLDGISLVPALGGKESPRTLYWHYPHYGNQGGEPCAIIREGEHKLIRYYEDGRLELYHLGEDPGEQQDLAAAKPDLVKTLSAKLAAHLTQVGAKIPKPDPRFDPDRKAQQLQNYRTKLKERLEKQHARFLEPDYRPNKSWWDSARTKD